MLVCEAAYRQDPSGIGDIFVTNAIDLKRHEAFERFALGLGPRIGKPAHKNVHVFR
ncbi:hypothetical protein CNE_2c11120 [Cupriavidus necator N-1]|uniref:Uncharacterized protein n=1 Tax=Cupriavidus necator (strain ATCC 43291 / DSM 13513 / CCUG 52238 / LMG 8453 / N-1) TaxID=1042878 RepID=F8GM59_CUPNN|nr:hypothetical protein CNE_2c11120 [Cupriavidus necator N-1]